MTQHKLTVREPVNRKRGFGFSDLWRTRDVAWLLALRDIKVKFRQTFIGFAWALIVPVVSLLLFSFVFGEMAGMPSDNLPYPLFLFLGLLPWQYFAKAVSLCGESITSNQQLVKKVALPKLIFPLYCLLPPFVDFCISLFVLICLLLYYGTVLDFAVIILFPVLMLGLILTSLSVGIWIAAINVEYRDVRFGLPFALQMGFFITPIVYSPNAAPQSLQWWFGLNPLSSLVTGFRWAMGAGPAPSWEFVLLSVGVTFVLFISGVMYFRAREVYFVDRI